MLSFKSEMREVPKDEMRKISGLVFEYVTDATVEEQIQYFIKTGLDVNEEAMSKDESITTFIAIRLKEFLENIESANITLYAHPGDPPLVQLLNTIEGQRIERQALLSNPLLQQHSPNRLNKLRLFSDDPESFTEETFISLNRLLDFLNMSLILHKLPKNWKIKGDRVILTGIGLTRIPMKAVKLIEEREPRTLYIDDNCLVALPNIINTLTSLHVVYANKNQIRFLPDFSRYGLTALAVFDLSNNQIEFLPDSISYLQEVSWLKLKGNPLKTFPPSFSKMNRLSCLTLDEGIDVPVSCAQILENSNNNSLIPTDRRPEPSLLDKLMKAFTSLTLSPSPLPVLPAFEMTKVKTKTAPRTGSDPLPPSPAHSSGSPRLRAGSS